MRRQIRVASSPQFRVHSAEVLASFGVVVAAVTLIALVWINTARSIDAERGDLQARVEATVSGQALVLADFIRREMLGVDQSLRILKQAFQVDPDKFDMRVWREQMPVLTDVTDDIFIADENLIIRHDIYSRAVGLPIGSMASGMVAPLADRPDRDDSLMIGPTLETLRTRQHVALMLMRLDRPGGWVIGASYRTNVLARVFAEAGLGVQGMTAFIDTRQGQIRAIAGPGADSPTYDIAESPMYAAMTSRPDGTWIGPSSPDGVPRIHGFHHIPGRAGSVVVAVNEAEAMRGVTHLADASRSLALIATAVILVAAVTALYGVWSFRAKRRLRQTIEREAQMVASTQAELAEARTRLDGRLGQLRAMLGNVGEGVALFDGESRLTEWNQPFPAVFGAAPEMLQPGLPLDELLRLQAREGAFGPLNDLEAEVGQRAARLRGGTGAAPALHAGPDGRPVAVITSRQSDGSLLLLARLATAADLEPAEEPPPDPDAAPAPGTVETL
ncbi:MAG: PAS-domain containing protein [Acetobacteraceae bacterium]